jgi:hypothetical protein
MYQNVRWCLFGFVAVTNLYSLLIYIHLHPKAPFDIPMRARSELRQKPLVS